MNATRAIITIAGLLVLLAPGFSQAAPSLGTRLKGQILLQVQSHGEAWWVNPVGDARHYLKDGNAAYSFMRRMGLGISEADYAKLAAGDKALRSRLMGQIILRVHAHGEAYYLCPRTGRLDYLKDGSAAFGIMRSCGLGITDSDLAQIPLFIEDAVGNMLDELASGNATANSSAAASLAGCPMFPADNPWNQDVSNLPLSSNSAAYIASIGVSKGLHPDFGETREYGIPYNIADDSTKKYSVNFGYADESDSGPYPISAAPEIEAGSDQHLLVLQKDECRLYELYAAELNGNQGAGWHAGSGAIFDLRSNALRPAGWTSADAAGLPILPGLVRYDEVNAGAINHAIRFTAPNTQRAYIAPATHYASSSTDPTLPPMGLRVRLKASYDISNLPTQAKVIATAMKKYGMILADNGSSWFFQGAWSPGWRDDDLNTLKNIPGSAFEAVDTGSLVK
jgi:hypothetical protein